MDDKLLEEIKRLRQDIEVQTALNVIAGVNTVETLAVVGHFLRTQRAPNDTEMAALERTARERWAEQVAHTMALLRNQTELDERMTALARQMAKGTAGRAGKPGKSATKKAGRR